MSESMTQLTIEQRQALARAYRYLLVLAAKRRNETAEPASGAAANTQAAANSPPTSAMREHA
ncbi:MAG: hypothetical protein KKA73_21510 [Chloroflexi bacterium]|nr:hypothetical protein [Chloroflexota bacterium]MBU1750272.1 hypothetical protein [Chloroflexota bacterium]